MLDRLGLKRPSPRGKETGKEYTAQTLTKHYHYLCHFFSSPLDGARVNKKDRGNEGSFRRDHLLNIAPGYIKLFIRYVAPCTAISFCISF